MLSNTAEIRTNSGKPCNACTVSAKTLISDFVHQYATSPYSYLIVEDERGCPIGVVEAADVLRRIDTPNAAERRRWLNMPIETVITARMLLPEPKSNPIGVWTSRPQSIDGAAIFHDDRLVAISTEDDVLVSWRCLERALKKAQHDHVTDLPNRAALDSHLVAECARASRGLYSVGMILIDVDHFKDVNDKHGHAAGDRVLATVARVLRRSLRSYDFVARFGGDEFAVICCGCRPGEIEGPINRIRRRVRSALSDPTIPQPAPTLSIGACVVHDMDLVSGPDEMLNYADECLYFSKRGGRNRSFTTEIGADPFVSQQAPPKHSPHVANGV
ncbi:MAG: GGDEF domain-containing protein [Planctomyces sp.]|nr:GGDEF domain-containing protein [Planctomyces sp.]